MKVAVFSAKAYDKRFLLEANTPYGFTFKFFEPHLDESTVKLAAGYQAVCVFVHDDLNAATVAALAEAGVQLIALRCAGYNNVDLAAAKACGLTVVRVPAYSPHAVAEHAIALILGLNRRIYRAYNRVREGNFSLEGLMGFDLHGSTAGVVGTGKIGLLVAQILKNGFGCHVMAYDPYPTPACTAMGIAYAPLPELLAQSDIVSLHCPLSPQTYHLMDEAAIQGLKPGAMVINTSRGALIDTRAAIEGLKSGQIGALGLDVYEEEGDLFFEDLSTQVIQDDQFTRLLTFPNVLITGHQAFFTENAVRNIADTTLANIQAFDSGAPCVNQVSPPAAAK